MGGRSSPGWPQWETWALLPPSGTGRWELPRTTYQEALKFLGFCDVDPAVFLHHLNVLHLIVEPRPSTQAWWSLQAARPQPRRAPGSLRVCWSKDLGPRPTPPARRCSLSALSPAPAWACLRLSAHPSTRPPGLSEAQTPGSAKASGPRAPHPSSPQPRGDVHPRAGWSASPLLARAVDPPQGRAHPEGGKGRGRAWSGCLQGRRALSTSGESQEEGQQTQGML